MAFMLYMMVLSNNLIDKLYIWPSKANIIMISVDTDLR